MRDGDIGSSLHMRACAYTSKGVGFFSTRGKGGLGR